MLRLNYYAEWLYYGFWYCAAWVVLSLPRAVAWKPALWGWQMRQPYYWIVQQGWVFPYFYTLGERREMSSNNQGNGRDDVTPFVGLKLMAGPHRAIVVEHVDDTQVYFAIHDDRSRSYFPTRHRILIAEWMRVAAAEVAAGKETIAPNVQLNGPSGIAAKVRVEAPVGREEE